jgi:hypothetical protein
MALLLTFAAPVAAAPPFRDSGTSQSLSSYSVDCQPQGSRTTCTETGLEAFSISPTEVVVCVSEYTYTYSERTGRGRLVDERSGCSEPVPSSTLNVTVSGDQIIATLAETDVTFYECNRRGCTEGDTVTVSASDSGGPVATYTNRGSFKDGTCTFRYSESGSSAPVSGTLTIDGVTMAEEGWASVSKFTVQENCR